MCGTTSFHHVSRLILVNTQNTKFLQNGVACPYMFWYLPTHFCMVWLCIPGERLWCAPPCLGGVEQVDCWKWYRKGEQQRTSNLLLLILSFPRDIMIVIWEGMLFFCCQGQLIFPVSSSSYFYFTFFKFGVLCFQKIGSDWKWSFVETNHSHFSEKILFNLQALS